MCELVELEQKMFAGDVKGCREFMENMHPGTNDIKLNCFALGLGIPSVVYMGYRLVSADSVAKVFNYVSVPDMEDALSKYGVTLATVDLLTKNAVHEMRKTLRLPLENMPPLLLGWAGTLLAGLTEHRHSSVRRRSYLYLVENIGTKMAVEYYVGSKVA